MLDIRFICENPELVKENIKKKFEDKKLPLVTAKNATQTTARTNCVQTATK